MEDLNKHQIILLTLLISFVTSIATGIMTVSLLQEAPLEVTRNINRVVEKTIEKVTPTILTSGNKDKEVTTVVVKEEDRIVDAIAKNTKSIVRINERDGLLDTVSVYGIGIILSKDGLIVAPRKPITGGNGYTAIMNDGTQFNLSVVPADKKGATITFKILQSEKEKKREFTPATFADADIKLGQSIISLGGDITNAVSVGRVVSLATKTLETASTTSKYISGIETDLYMNNLVDGSPLFNLSGDVVGVIMNLSGSKYFTPISIVKKDLANSEVKSL